MRRLACPLRLPYRDTPLTGWLVLKCGRELARARRGNRRQNRVQNSSFTWNSLWKLSRIGATPLLRACATAPSRAGTAPAPLPVAGGRPVHLAASAFRSARERASALSADAHRRGACAASRTVARRREAKSIRLTGLHLLRCLRITHPVTACHESLFRRRRVASLACGKSGGCGGGSRWRQMEAICHSWRCAAPRVGVQGNTNGLPSGFLRCSAYRPAVALAPAAAPAAPPPAVSAVAHRRAEKARDRWPSRAASLSELRVRNIARSLDVDLQDPDRL